MKKILSLLLLVFATASFASFSFTLLNVTTDFGHGCQYYLLNEGVGATAISAPTQSFNAHVGSIKDGGWSYLATVNKPVWQPNIACASYLDANGTTRQSCTDQGQYVNTTTQQWQPYTALKYFSKPTELEYCADYEMHNGAVSIDVIPTIGGRSFSQFAWFNATWGYKAPCHINTTVSTSLKNFPAYCVIDTQSLIAAGKMKPDCSDLRAVNSSETGSLNYEIVNNTCNTTSTYVWVGIPATTTGGIDTVYIYYGNPSAINAQNAPGLWAAANYSGVYHTAEKSGSLVDSAGNNVLTNVTSGNGTIRYGLASPSGFGILMNATTTAKGARFKNSSVVALPRGSHPYTVSWWQNKSTNDGCNGGGIFSLGTYGTNTIIYVSQITTSPYYIRVGYNSPPAGPSYTPYNAFQFFAINNSGSTKSSAFKNGTLVNNTLTTDGGNIGTGLLELGGDDFSVSDCNDIEMSEIRIRNGSSSSDWIAAQYGQISSMGAEQRLYVPLIVTISSPINSTYISNPAISITCSGDNSSYLLNVTSDGSAILSNQNVTNGTLFSFTNTFSPGRHLLNATCWNGTYQDSSVVAFTLAQVYFASPTPANNTNDFTFPITLNMTADAPLSPGSYIEIDGTNYSCTNAADSLSCSYAIPYSDTVFNHTYSAKGYANGLGGFGVTNETNRSIPYYGCGYVNGDAALIGDLTTPGKCLTINASGITVDGQGHVIAGYPGSSGFDSNGISGVYSNNLIKNLNITGFSSAIWISGTYSNDVFDNVNIYGVGYGFDQTNYYGGPFDDAVISNSMIHDNAWGTAWLAGSNVTFINDTFYNNDVGSHELVSGNPNSYSNCHFYNNSEDIWWQNPQGSDVLQDTIFDNPAGGYDNYTNLSLAGLGSGYSVIISTVPAPEALPANYASFGQFMSVDAKLSNLSFNWLDSQLSDYDESRFTLWKYNDVDGWKELNSSPDTDNNQLSYGAINLSGDVVAMLESGLSETLGSSVYGSSAQYKAPCYISTTVGSLPYFPVYCILDTATLIDEGHMRPDCADLRVSDSTESVALPFEIASGTCNSSATWVWVGDPTASDDDTIWLNYGDLSLSDGQNATAVWEPAGYSAVWHEGEPSGIVRDSLANNNLAPHITGNGAIAYQQSSPRGYGIHVIGTSSGDQARLTRSSVSGLPSGSDNWTLTWWQNKTDANGNDGSPVIRWGNFAYNQEVYMSQRTLSPYFLRIGGYYAMPNSGLNWTPFGSWQFFAVTGYNGNSADTYQNGEPVDTALSTDIGNIGTGAFDVGGDTYYTNDWNDVLTSEIRVRDVVSSADWIKAEYAQTSSTGDEVPESTPPIKIKTSSSSTSSSTPSSAMPTLPSDSVKKAKKAKKVAPPPVQLKARVSSRAGALSAACIGDNDTYMLNVTADGSQIIFNQEVANGTPFKFDADLSGVHTLTASCWNGPYQDSTSRKLGKGGKDDEADYEAHGGQ